MSIVPDFAGPLAVALTDMCKRAGAAVAAEVPADVAVSLTGEGLAITGRALSLRAVSDPRLRDFAAIARTSIGSGAR